MPIREGEAPRASDLLNIESTRLVEYLERNGCADGGFDVSNIIDLESLSTSQRSQLASRLRAAALLAEKTATSESVNISALLSRLTSIAVDQNNDGGDDNHGDKDDDGHSPAFGTSRSLPSPSRSSEGTPPPTTAEDVESASYHELLRSGSKPICTLKTFRLILKNHNVAAGSDGVLSPWLSADWDLERRGEERWTVFSRQLSRWWDFCKFQWHNRCPGSAEDGEAFTAFLEAERRIYQDIGAHEMVADSSFEETVKRLWQQKPAFQILPGEKKFAAYKGEVARRLAPYNFRQPLRLKKDPRQQRPWDTWLEYLVFEQWWSEKYDYDISVEVEDCKYNNAWSKILDQLARGAGSAQDKGSLQSDPSEGSRFGQRRQSTKGVTTTAATAAAADFNSLAAELHAVRAELDWTRQALGSFIRDTAAYQRKERAARQQRRRVQWVLAEARAWDADMSKQHQGEAKQSVKIDSRNSSAGRVRLSGKRRRGDEDDNVDDYKSLRLRPKRTKGEDNGNGSAATSRSRPTNTVLPSSVTRRLRSANSRASTSAAQQRLTREVGKDAACVM